MVEVALAQAGEEFVFAQGAEGVEVEAVGFLQRQVDVFQRRYPFFQRPAEGEVFAVDAGFVALQFFDDFRADFVAVQKIENVKQRVQK